MATIKESIKYELISLYSEGRSIKFIQEELGINEEEVKEVLLNYKEESRHKNTFTENFKMTIADRDLSGVKRNQIAKELDLNIHTIRKACEHFGEQFKDFPKPNNVSTIVKEGEEITDCPSCKSSKVNQIDSIIEGLVTEGVYCMECGEEHFVLDGFIHKVNWEYIE